MIDPRGPFRTSHHLALAAALGLATLAGGCGQPGEGTVAVSPEARARLMPHTAETAKDRKGRPIGNRPVGAKSKILGGAKSS